MTREEKKAILKADYMDDVKAVVVSVALMSGLLELEDSELGSLFLEVVLDEIAEIKAKKEKVNNDV